MRPRDIGTVLLTALLLADCAALTKAPLTTPEEDGAGFVMSPADLLWFRSDVASEPTYVTVQA